MTINSERLDSILDSIESEVPGENRGDLIFRGENGVEFDFEINDTSDGVNVYHDTILLEEVEYDDDEDRLAEDLLEVIFPYLDV